MTVAGKSVRLETAGLPVVTMAPDWRTQLMALITNPNIAFLLMLIGVYGLIFEFATPGTLVPGTVGAICLLVALYALNVLPVNYAGIGLVLLGVALMVAELFIGSLGVIGIAGVISFGIGSFMMFDPGIPASSFRWPWSLRPPSSAPRSSCSSLSGCCARAGARW